MSRLRSYAQLVRLPNVFTAAADICLGALAVGALPSRGLPFGLLVLASGSLYCGGMVWNDFFDVEQDRKERPFRPIPSGRISRPAAAGFGAALLASGLLFALLAGWSLSGWREPETGGGLVWTPLVLSIILAVCIVLYDAWLKRTWAGPVGMGACRFLNVLLGLSVAGQVHWPWDVYLAFVVGVYIAGVTWFARTEVRSSSQTALTGAAAVMLAGLVLGLAVPLRLEAGESPWLFPYLLVGLGFLVGLPVCRAIAVPTPARVQAAVKSALLGLVGLDAVLATALAGPWGLAVLFLLIPTLILGRWLYST
jgi:4-hydroxybenzoate polyprenyltransferase